MSLIKRTTDYSNNLGTIPSLMTEEDEHCVVFLMTLKYRNVASGVLDGLSLAKNRFRGDFTIENNEIEEKESNFYGGPSTSSTMHNKFPFGITKNDAVHNDFPATKTPLPSPLSVPLSLPEDKLWLSDLQCFIRSHCVEFFSTTEADVTHPPSIHGVTKFNKRCSPGGRRGPLTVGRVGIRCVFCRDVAQSRRATQSTSFPSQINGIYGAVVMLQSRHFPNCHMMPSSVRQTLATSKRGGTASTAQPDKGGGNLGRQQYWAESARKLGLIDTLDGIRFCHETKDSGCAVPDFSSSMPGSTSNDTGDGRRMNDTRVAAQSDNSVTAVPSSGINREVTPEPTFSLCGPAGEESPIDLSLPSSLEGLLCGSALVFPEDKDLVPDYLFIAMAQMEPCYLEEADRVGCYKSRNIGFLGMCCKHCGGQPGFGKYFPASVRSLAQTTTSQTIVKHISAKCARVPPNVRNAVLALQRDSHKDKVVTSQATGDGRPRYGSRKVFFQRIWGRVHGKSSSKRKSGILAPRPVTNKPTTPPGAPQPCVISPFRNGEIDDDVTEEASSGDSCDSSIGEETADSYNTSTRSYDYEAEEIEEENEATYHLHDDQNRRVLVRGEGVFTQQHVLPRKKRKAPASIAKLENSIPRHEKAKRRRIHRGN